VLSDQTTVTAKYKTQHILLQGETLFKRFKPAAFARVRGCRVTCLLHVCRHISRLWHLWPETEAITLVTLTFRPILEVAAGVLNESCPSSSCQLLVAQFVAANDWVTVSHIFFTALSANVIRNVAQFMTRGHKFECETCLCGKTQTRVLVFVTDLRSGCVGRERERERERARERERERERERV